MKRSNWKKSVVALTLCSFAMASNLAFPNRAQAAIGLASWNPVLVIVGAVVAGVSAGGGGIVTGVNHRRHVVRVVGPVSITGLVIGLVLLDKDQGVYTYQEMTPEMAKKLDVKEDNRKAYNAELDRINLLGKTVAEQLSLERDPSVEASAAIWKQYQDRISPEAAVAFQQVNENLASALK